ncbi:MAG: ribonuclease [Firmicutes bacterium]|nr:ribonuclease [Bacillota bacterium]
MKKKRAFNFKKLLALALVFLLFFGYYFIQEKARQRAEEASLQPAGEAGEEVLAEDGSYTSKEDVALYLWTYGKLPGNFITKTAAQKKGWEGGSLEKYAPGKCIGGDRFGNYEGHLPDGVKYRECDIDTLGAKSRGEKRIVYAEDCSAIYYTEDHYNSFELLYGKEKK